MCNGLQPEEKLDEELLIDAESEAAAHPLTHRARERALAVLARLVLEWRRGWEPGGVNIRTPFLCVYGHSIALACLG